jgi:hypothetical protein
MTESKVGAESLLGTGDDDPGRTRLDHPREEVSLTDPERSRNRLRNRRTKGLGGFLAPLHFASEGPAHAVGAGSRHLRRLYIGVQVGVYIYR